MVTKYDADFFTITLLSGIEFEPGGSFEAELNYQAVSVLRDTRPLLKLSKVVAYLVASHLADRIIAAQHQTICP